MSRARIILIMVAVIAGGLAALLVVRGNDPKTETISVTQIKQEAKAKVLVASRAIGVGERLSAQSLEWQDWPEGAVRPEYVTIALVPEAPQELTGAVARFEFFPGEPIREAKLARSDQGYLSAVIEPGKRAVSIDVTTTSGAGGFIVPNDRVDVVLTRSTRDGKQSETILLNVKVLAIGLRLGEKGATGGVDEADPKTQVFDKQTIATLELNPSQSETLINSAQLGQLALALRSVADFGEKIDPNRGAANGSTIRMVRFGKTANTTTGVDRLSPTAPNMGASQMANVQAPVALTPSVAMPTYTPQVSTTLAPSDGPLPPLKPVQ